MRSIIFLTLTGCALLAACGGSEQADVAAKANQQESAPVASAPANGAAPAANAAESIRARQAHYEEMGKAMKGISDELKKGSPSVDIIKTNASTINGLAPQILGWFPDGSGAEAGLKTDARAEIWSKPAEFKESAQKFITAAASFNQTAQAGDLDSIRASVKELGGTCKGCHDEFRIDD